MASSPQGPTCSFCNIAMRDAKKLIAGPAVYICDECIGLCVDILAEDKEGKVEGDTPAREIARLRSELNTARRINGALVGALQSIEFTIATHKAQVAEAVAEGKEAGNV